MKYTEKFNLIWILYIMVVICLSGILYCAYVLLCEHGEYRSGNHLYQQLCTIGKSTTITKLNNYNKALLEEKQKYKESRIDFTSLKKINSDVVAWIALKDTKIDYPVVKGKDNNYYLNHLFNGTVNKLGTIFVDYKNNEKFLDRNTIIYGHNMKDGSMFSSIVKYKEQSYYKNFPSMMIYTPKGNFKVELFAGVVVDGSYDSIPFSFKNDKDFKKYINYLEKESTFKSNIIVKSSDKIITMCTCSYEFNNARYILCGKLVPIASN